MDYISDKIKTLPRWIVVTTAAILLFFTLFFSLSSHTKADNSCDFIFDYEGNFVDYEEGPVGSDPFWTDFEFLPYHIEVGLNVLRPQIAGTLFAYSASSNNVSPPLSASGVNASMDWSVGFSVGAGYEFFQYDWDFLAKYSFFTTTLNNTVSSPFNGSILPALGVGLNGQRVSGSTSKLGFTWNNLDITLDKKFHFRENLLLFTTLGLESTWLGYNQTVTYTGGPFLGFQSATVKRTSDLWGIGPEVGLKTNWLFVDCFYLKGFTTGALQYISQNTSYSETATYQGYNPLIFSDSIDFVAPSLSLGLGFGFAKYYCADARFIRFEFLYEQRTLFRQNQLLDVAPYTTPRFTHSANDLSLQGFTFKIDFRY